MKKAVLTNETGAAVMEAILKRLNVAEARIALLIKENARLLAQLKRLKTK